MQLYEQNCVNQMNHWDKMPRTTKPSCSLTFNKGMVRILTKSVPGESHLGGIIGQGVRGCSLTLDLEKSASPKLKTIECLLL